MKQTKVVIVGAGPAGLGCAALLRQMGISQKDLCVLEAKTIGSSFKAWPKEMRMITPSFPSNGYHQTDLNGITPDTSPAFSLGKEHPSGRDYADYLKNIGDHYEIPIEEHTKVVRVEPQELDSFQLTTENGELIRTQFLIWAGGEFSSPRTNAFPGSELCLHNSEVETWDLFQEQAYTVIGGYESGVDAAFNLATRGKRVTLLDSSSGGDDTYDPSRVLSPYTSERLASMANLEYVELLQDFKVEIVRQTVNGFELISTSGKKVMSPSQPINCTGFNSHLGPVSELFEMGENGFPLVNKYDESTLCRNLFLSGPKLVHGNVLLCFIYKFRGRFATPCSIIAAELGLDIAILNHYQQAGMLLDDLTCCESQQCFC